MHFCCWSLLSSFLLKEPVMLLELSSVPLQLHTHTQEKQVKISPILTRTHKVKITCLTLFFNLTVTHPGLETLWLAATVLHTTLHFLIKIEPASLVLSIHVHSLWLYHHHAKLYDVTEVACLGIIPQTLYCGFAVVWHSHRHVECVCNQCCFSKKEKQAELLFLFWTTS